MVNDHEIKKDDGADVENKNDIGNGDEPWFGGTSEKKTNRVIVKQTNDVLVVDGGGTSSFSSLKKDELIEEDKEDDTIVDESENAPINPSGIANTNILKSPLRVISATGTKIRESIRNGFRAFQQKNEILRNVPYFIEKGTQSFPIRESCKISFPYEFYLPAWNDPETSFPCVIIVHGFQGSSDFHVGTAEGLVGKKTACLLIDWSSTSILGFTLQQRRRNRERIILGLCRLFEWVTSRSDVGIDPNRIGMLGHSAGAGLIHEAAIELMKRKRKDPSSAHYYPRCLLYLDGVPWISTIERGKSDSLTNFLFRDPEFRNLQSPSPCVVCSIRGEPSAWNGKGQILQLLGRGMGNVTLSRDEKHYVVVDIKVNGAKHLDFAFPDENGSGFSKWLEWIGKRINLLTDSNTQGIINKLVLAFFASEFISQLDLASNKPDPFAHTTRQLKAGELIFIEQVRSENLPPLVSPSVFLS